jgi:hypothetical protein
MTNAAALLEVEHITLKMLDAATREDLTELAALEDQRRLLIDRLDTAFLKASQQKPVLLRIINCNSEITRRLENRRNDIGSLLQALGEPAPLANK